jgi:hypothetical protein
LKGLCFDECLSRSIAAGGLLLWSAKVTKALVGKKLLYALYHAAQAVRTHRPGYFALLTLAPSQPFCKISNAFSNAQFHHCSVSFWPKLFADVGVEARAKKQDRSDN